MMTCGHDDTWEAFSLSIDIQMSVFICCFQGLDIFGMYVLYSVIYRYETDLDL